MLRRLALLLALAALTLTPARANDLPDDATRIRPVLVGSTLPDVALRTPAGEAVQTTAALAGQPTVVIMYRGGWCPICNRQLADLAKVLPQLRELGYQIAAVSPDRPAKLLEAAAQVPAGLSLYSDSSLALARALGLAFRVDDATIAKYKEYKIDLEAASGETHHGLPVPAVLILQPGGRIAFLHADPDYRHRLSGDAVLAIARSLLPPAKP